MSKDSLPAIDGWEIKQDRGHITLFSKEPPGSFLSDRSGIRIDVNKKDRTLSIDGWYDSMVGITGGTISLDDITKLFKPITKSKVLL